MSAGDGGIHLLVVSPRVPAGLMTREAWQVLENADRRLGRSADEPLVEVATDSGCVVEVPDDVSPAALARSLVADAEAGCRVVWLGSTDADPGLTDALAEELTRLDDPPSVEVVVGSWDAPGSRLLDAVAVMDVLRSPGGCPWDAEQTHGSLAPYLVEESFEVVEAIAEQDDAGLQEELGDVLLQVLFHSRVAQERGEGGFDIDGVGATLVEKLLRRHPHVFGEGEVGTAADVEAQWARIKAEEKPERDVDDPFVGIPTGLPPLERAVKMVSRAHKHGFDEALSRASAADTIGAALLDLVVQARELGVDPSVALSATLHEVGEAVHAQRANRPDLPAGHPAGPLGSE